MNSTQIETFATEISASLTIGRYAPHCDHTFTYSPRVTVRETSRGRVLCVYAEVNAVQTKAQAKEMLNAFQAALIEKLGPDVGVIKVVKVKARTGRTSLQAHTFYHMSHYNVEGYFREYILPA